MWQGLHTELSAGGKPHFFHPYISATFPHIACYKCGMAFMQSPQPVNISYDTFFIHIPAELFWLMFDRGEQSIISARLFFFSLFCRAWFWCGNRARIVRKHCNLSKYTKKHCFSVNIRTGNAKNIPFCLFKWFCFFFLSFSFLFFG